MQFRHYYRLVLKYNKRKNRKLEKYRKLYYDITLFKISPNTDRLGSALGTGTRIGLGVVARFLALPRKFSLLIFELFLVNLTFTYFLSAYMDFCL